MSKRHLKNIVKEYFMKGKTYVEIQELTGVSPQTQCNWVKKYKWDEERDRIEAAPESLSAVFRQKLAHNLGNLEPDEKGNYPMSWDAYCKASKTIKNLGDVNDELAAIRLAMDKFSRFVKAQNWVEEKVNHIFEAINAFLDQVAEEI